MIFVDFEVFKLTENPFQLIDCVTVKNQQSKRIIMVKLFFPNRNEMLSSNFIPTNIFWFRRIVSFSL